MHRQMGVRDGPSNANSQRWSVLSGSAVVTHSNFKAATALGNPETKATISHGRSLSLDVLTAPPFASPLCCFNRRGGFGVDPMYSDAWLTVERNI